MIWIVVAVLGVWLLLLTLVVASFARNFASLVVAARAGQVPLATMDFDADGPAIGAQVTSDVIAICASSTGTHDLRLLLFVSPGCGTCLETVEEFSRRPALLEGTTVFVLGTSDPTGRPVTDLLTPLNGAIQPKIVVGEPARNALQRLEITSLPFVVAMADDHVEAKLFVRRVPALVDLLDAQSAALDRPHRFQKGRF